MMQGKVALEEHCAIPETLQDCAGFVPGECWAELKSRLLDTQDRRLRELDAHGTEMMLLSLNAPAVQAIADRAHATSTAKRAVMSQFEIRAWSVTVGEPSEPERRDCGPSVFGGKRNVGFGRSCDESRWG